MFRSRIGIFETNSSSSDYWNEPDAYEESYESIPQEIYVVFQNDETHPEILENYLNSVDADNDVISNFLPCDLDEVDSIKYEGNGYLKFSTHISVKICHEMVRAGRACHTRNTWYHSVDDMSVFCPAKGEGDNDIIKQTLQDITNEVIADIVSYIEEYTEDIESFLDENDDIDDDKVYEFVSKLNIKAIDIYGEEIDSDAILSGDDY